MALCLARSQCRAPSSTGPHVPQVDGGSTPGGQRSEDCQAFESKLPHQCRTEPRSILADTSVSRRSKRPDSQHPDRLPERRTSGRQKRRSTLAVVHATRANMCCEFCVTYRLSPVQPMPEFACDATFVPGIDRRMPVPLSVPISVVAQQLHSALDDARGRMPVGWSRAQIRVRVQQSHATRTPLSPSFEQHLRRRAGRT